MQQEGLQLAKVFNMSVAHLLMNLKVGDSCEWLCNTRGHLLKEKEIAYVIHDWCSPGQALHLLKV